MEKILQLIKAEEKENGLEYLANRVGVSYSFLYSLVNSKYNKVNKNKLEKLYDHYHLDKDSFFIDNLRKWYKPNNSILGNIFMVRRIQKGRTVWDVARIIKGDIRSINRIEKGNSLPSYRGRYIVSLMKLYELTEDEVTKIQRLIVNMNDALQILRKYDLEGFTLEAMGYSK